MECPYCGKEMANGYIYNPRGIIAWTPEEEKPNVMQSKAKDYQIELGEHPTPFATKVDTFYCANDKLFLIKE